jgi:hypothetical protein
MLRIVGADAFLADIDEAVMRLASFPDVSRYFRFPFLDEGTSDIERRDAVRAGLEERGLINGYVTVDTYDWFMASLFAEAFASGQEPDLGVVCDVYTQVLIDNVEFYDTIAREVLDRSPAHILLLHENDLAALCVDDLAYALIEAEWEIIPALEAYTDAIAEREPDTLFLGQGRVAALAHEAGWRPRDLIHESEDEDYLREAFVREGILSGEN